MGSTHSLGMVHLHVASLLSACPCGFLLPSSFPRAGMIHSRYWQRSPRKPGRHRHWGWLPWLTEQVLLLAQ